MTQKDCSPKDITRRDALKWMATGAGAILTGVATRTPAAAPDAPWSELRSALDGALIRNTENGYEATRSSLIWNGRKTVRRPDAIVQAVSEADVRAAVRFANQHDLKVAVRGAGHSWIGASVRNGGILIDVSGLTGVDINPDDRTARVQPGIRNVTFVPMMTQHGLAFPVGHCPTVPMSGYLLNGGLGWNGGTWGPACASVTAIELVTAEGESIYASEARNPEYLWAARGAGPGFPGVVTRFHLRLHELPRAIRTNVYIYSLDEIDALAAWLAEANTQLPKGVEMTSLITRPPPDPSQPGALAPHVLMVMASAFAGTEDEARSWLEPLDGAPAKPLHADRFMETPIEILLAKMSEAMPPGMRYDVDFMWTQSVPADVLPLMLDTMKTAPSPRSFLMIHMPPPPDGALPDMAFSMASRTLLGVHGIWPDEAQDAENTAWTRSMIDQVDHLFAGGYIGETDLTRTPERPSQCFAPANWQKLVSLKARLDPDNRFFWYPTA